MPQEHKGGCLCGDIRYRVHSEPLVQCYCCCETCQGAARWLRGLAIARRTLPQEHRSWTNPHR